MSGANDLLKLLSEINGEIDEFNKNAWRGVLQEILNRLKHKLGLLGDVEKWLKELETGITETQQKIND